MIPLSLYIHIPWCIQKCPYCDFNSHKSPQQLPEFAYVQTLVNDLDEDLKHFQSPPTIQTIFIGGGTPSLLSAAAYTELFNQLKKRLSFSQNIEITLEANPGTVDQERFKTYYQIGINRLSLGIQSFNPAHLKKLGRIHDEKQAHRAIDAARNAGFSNINLDLMYGLPGQSIPEGIADLQIAIAHQPEHISWYQLTIEPNTVFYKERPVVPVEDDIISLEEQGLDLLKESGLSRYEISAFSSAGRRANHNLNYWLYGDYLGIGAGAHGKITLSEGIKRIRKIRQPKDYLNPEKMLVAEEKWVTAEEQLFEFMLNTTRLEQPIPYQLFTERTTLPINTLLSALKKAEAQNLVHCSDDSWQVSALGRLYTNNLQTLFLP